MSSTPPTTTLPSSKAARRRLAPGIHASGSNAPRSSRAEPSSTEKIRGEGGYSSVPTSRRESPVQSSTSRNGRPFATDAVPFSSVQTRTFVVEVAPPPLTANAIFLQWGAPRPNSARRRGREGGRRSRLCPPPEPSREAAVSPCPSSPTRWRRRPSGHHENAYELF